MKNGYRPEHIVVTGWPKYDELFRSKHDSAETRERLGFSDADMVVVFLCQPSSTNEVYLSMIFSAVKGMPSAKLVIKTHPRMPDKSIFKKIAKRVGIDVRIESEGLYELLNACDVVITKSSMASTEAALADRPIIIFDPIDKTDMTSSLLVKKGIALGVYDESGLLPTIKSINSSKETLSRLKKGRAGFMDSVGFDGKATERVLGVIDSVSGQPVKKVLVFPNIATHLLVLKPLIDGLKRKGYDVMTLRYEIGYRNLMKKAMKGVEYMTLRSNDWHKKRDKSLFWKSMKMLFLKEKPDLIIVCDFTSSLMKPVLSDAKSMGISSIAIQWGNIDDWYDGGTAEMPVVDRIAVISEHDKKTLIEEFGKSGWMSQKREQWPISHSQSL